MKFVKLSEDKLKMVVSINEIEELTDLDEFMENPQKGKEILMDILEEAYYQVGFDAQNYKIRIDAKQTKSSIIFMVTKLIKLQNSNDEDAINFFPEKSSYNIFKSLENEKNKMSNTKTKNEIKNTTKNKSSKISNSDKKTNNKNGNLSAKENNKITKLKETANSNKPELIKKVKPKKVQKPKAKIVVYEFEDMNDFINFCKILKKNNIKSFKNFCDESELYKWNEKYYLAISNINSNFKKMGVFFTNVTEFSTFYTDNLTSYFSIREKGESFIKENALLIGENL